MTPPITFTKTAHGVSVCRSAEVIPIGKAHASREIPMLFCGELVRAILDGTKTRTMRLVRPQPERVWTVTENGIMTDWGPADADGEPIDEELRSPCVVGDRLWVRETWGTTDADPPWVPNGRKPKQGDRIVYRADPAADAQWGAGLPSQGGFVWRPSIHMPRWASRISLEVTGVRVHRLQEITEDEARSEGVTPRPHDPEGDCWTDGKHRTAVEYLWNELHGWDPNAWASNPWVWAIEFRRVKP